MGLAGVVLGLVAGVGLSVVPLSGASADPVPDVSVGMLTGPVSLADAGEISLWGPNDVGQGTVPASLSGVAVRQVALSNTVTLALTSAGKVVGWGGNLARLQRIPDPVNATPIAQIAAGNSYAGVVTRAGRVHTWGLLSNRPTPLNVPTGLSGVKQLVISEANAVALKTDGTVVAWGEPTTGINSPPPGLKATALVAGASTVYAVTDQGTLTGWGDNSSNKLNFPAVTQQPGNVKAIAAYSIGGIALLANNTLVGWGGFYSNNGFPAWLSTLTPAGVTGGSAFLGMVDDQGVIHQWYPGGLGELNTVPSELNGLPVAQFSVGLDGMGAVIVTKMLAGDAPKVTGSPVVGGTLTGTAGTFSASPDSVTSRWLVNGVALSGATGTTLKMTPGLLGKKITYQSVASKSGQSAITSTSSAVTVANPPVVMVASKTKVTKVKVAKKAKKVTVTGKVTTTKPATGKAKVTIKKGKKTIVVKTVKVSTKGALKLKIKKFGKLAAKKTKAKGKKAKTAYRGKYTITINYAGNTQVKPSHTTKKIKMK